MKKRSVGITLIIISAFVFINSYILANPKDYFPEPPRKTEIPNNLVWNPESGGYYDPNESKWDSERRVYIDKKVKSIEEASIDNSKGDVKTIDEWVKKNKKSDDPLISAIIECIVTYEKTKTPKDELSLAFMNDSMKQAIKSITKLPPSQLASMRQMMVSDSYFNFGLLMQKSIIDITNIHNEYLSTGGSSSESCEEWVDEFDKFISKAPDAVKTASVKVKASKNKEEKEKVKDEIKNYGLFVLPYIKEEIDKGNYDMVEFIPDIVGDYGQVEKTNDKNYWKKWFKENEKDIKALKNLIK